MKIRSLLLTSSFFMLAPCTRFLYAETPTPAISGYQSKNSMQENLRGLLKPIHFTSTGIEDFLHVTFSDPTYATVILPNNFFHLAQFLEYGKKNKQAPTYTISALRLFTNKLKAAPYVNAHAFDEFLVQFPSLIGYQFKPYPEDVTDLLHLKISDLLYTQFINKFSLFKYDPNAFLDLVSYDIVTMACREFTRYHDHNPEELRKNCMMFLEIALSKLIWSPYDGKKTWQQFKAMASHLSGLHTNLCISINDLNDLYTSLLERYCFFIDISAVDLSNDFYHAIKIDKEKNKLALFAAGTKEQYLESNLKRFDRALYCAQARTRAYQQGLITH